MKLIKACRALLISTFQALATTSKNAPARQAIPFPPVLVLPAVLEHIRLKKELLTIRIDNIRIDEEVAAKDGNAATSVASKLSVENINAHLPEAGLPEAQVLSVPVVCAAPPPLAEPEGKSNDMTIIIAVMIVCAGVGVVVLGAPVCMYLRRRTLTKADLETKGVFS